MAREFAQKFYKSRAWKKCRTTFFILKHGICERCAGPGKIVHHKTYVTPNNINNPAVTLNFDNLELLCQDCHNKEHMSLGNTSYEVRFDEYGNIVKR